MAWKKGPLYITFSRNQKKISLNVREIHESSRRLMMQINTHIQQTAAERRVALESQYPTWPRETLATHFSKACAKHHDKAFIYIENQTVTYGEIWTNACIYAKSLLHLGVKRRDHVAILMENDPAYPSLMIATSMICAVVIPLNTMLGEEELLYILCQSDSDFLIAHQEVKGNHHGKVIANLLDEPTFKAEGKLQQVICIPIQKEELDPRFTTWERFCQGAKTITDKQLSHRFESSVYPDEVAMILYT